MHSLKVKPKTYLALEEVKLMLLKGQNTNFTRNEIIEFALRALIIKITQSSNVNA